MKKPSWLNDLEKHINNMTPKERLEHDKGVEEMKGEICPLHGDICECSKDTKRKKWNEMKGTK